MFLEFVVIIALLGALLVQYLRWNHGILEKLGIPIVKTHFLLGSQYSFTEVFGVERDFEWFQAHGEIYGVYSGRQPEIHILDPDIVRQIYIKDFDKFHNHKFNAGIAASPVLGELLGFISGDKWKTFRSAFYTNFTPTKLKRMSKHMIEGTDDMLNLLKTKVAYAPNGQLQDFNIYDEILSIELDVFVRCSLNIKMKDPRSPDNDFSKSLRELLPEVPPFVSTVVNLFPLLMQFIGVFSSKQLDGFLFQTFRKVMADRRKVKGSNDDFIDFLNRMMDKTTTEEYKKLSISEKTILAHACSFSLGGIDQIGSNLLVMILYTSQNPEIMQKLYDEVDAYMLRNNGNVTPDSLGELKYLNACICEALRLHPVFSRIDRLCNKDVEYKGLKIRKGMTVVTPLFAYHRNPKYFPDPHTFDPERFMPHNKINMDMITFASFGHGPRHCIGMKLSMQFMLIMGVKMFQKFHFTTKPGAQVEYLPAVFIGLSRLNPTVVNVTTR